MKAITDPALAQTLKSHRNTIYCCEATLVEHSVLPAGQYIVKLDAPDIAAAALPGQFVHLQCDPGLPMRRPFSIMRSDADAGWVELLYKVVGHGTALLAKQPAGGTLSAMGPIGRPFEAGDCRRPLLIGGGVGIPPVVFLAQHLRSRRNEMNPLVILGSEIPFPFTAKPSSLIVPGLPPEAIAAMPLLEDWGYASRLTSLQGYPGCYEGYVTDLARPWLAGLNDSQRSDVTVFACGPDPMLEAVAGLSREFNVPAQLCLEEFMACGVGGCAGCTVPVRTADGMAMRRVCVDGPVFQAADLYF